MALINVAKNKIATWNYGSVVSGHGTSLMLDELPNTQTVNEILTSSNQNGYTPLQRSILVDLGEIYSISSIKIVVAYGCTSAEFQYSIDGISFTTLNSMAGRPYNSTTELPFQCMARYVRIYGISSNYGKNANLGVTDFYVYEEDVPAIAFKNLTTNKYIVVENNLVQENSVFLSTTNNANILQILEHIKLNSIDFKIFSTKPFLKLEYNLKNEPILINNYNIPTSIKSINNFNVIGSNILCAIKKEDKNYIFKNSSWAEENDSSKWNSIVEFNSLTKEEISLLATASNCDININFIDKTSYLTKFEIVADIAGYYALVQESEYDILVSSNLEKIKITFLQDGTYRLNTITGTSSPS